MRKGPLTYGNSDFFDPGYWTLQLIAGSFANSQEEEIETLRWCNISIRFSEPSLKNFFDDIYSQPESR